MDNMDLIKLIEDSEKSCSKLFKRAEEIALFNQKKVLDAFIKNKIALRHFEQTSGYAYDDIGRNSLSSVYKDTFKAEAAIVSPLFASGTHTITTALFGILRPGDICLSVSDTPYDTLKKVINGGDGSLKDFGIEFICSKLKNNGAFNFNRIEKDIKKYKPQVIYLQRSKGYQWRNSFSINDIKNLCEFVKKLTEAPIIVDNCYGEFAEKEEPLEVGADLIMGSLIKNPGGGLAPTGGYICGKEKLINKIEGRYSAPGVGFEIGACPYGYRNFFQGFFIAPHIVLQSIKSSLLFGEVFKRLGFKVLNKDSFDIVRAIKFNNKEQLLAFCRAVQSASPVDGHVVPYPWPMPGYSHEVIMAAGTFIQGASIELSADAPIKEPYIAYVQGALTYEHAKLACLNCIKAIIELI